MPVPTRPLTDTELDRLDELLCVVNPGNAMSLEELDGFLCALICSPDVVPPAEYIPHICGGELALGDWGSTVEEEQELMNLLTRHWVTIASALHWDEPHPVLIGKYGNDGATGLDWAHGFELGMSLRDDRWAQLISDDRFAIALAPIVALAEAANPDSILPPMTPRVQAEAVGTLGASVLVVYRYFRNTVGSGSASEGWRRPQRAFMERMV